MSFAVSAESYDRFMGRYSVPLSYQFADFAGIVQPARVIDVGCGTGALTATLVKRLGPGAVTAVDPSDSFVAAARLRFPEVDVRQATAEDLPFADASFDAALAQLVVHFMADPISGIKEMRRVCKGSGVVAACVWDHAGDRGPLHPFWEVARGLDPDVVDESDLAGTREGHLGELFAAAGLTDIEEGALVVEYEHPSFEDWWEPFTLGVGPAGAYVSGLRRSQQAELRERCQRQLGPGPFMLSATAWAARGNA
jgi:SAM-dependent methyltransferase